jgi:hypothetical protein
MPSNGQASEARQGYLSLYGLQATNVLLEIPFLTSKTEKIIDRGRQPANI